MFDIDARDLPRSARLCFVIYGFQLEKSGKSTKGKARKRGEQVPMAWVNTNVFEYNGGLRMGSLNLPCWPCDSALEEV